jgi:hypothetical protein
MIIHFALHEFDTMKVELLTSGSGSVLSLLAIMVAGDAVTLYFLHESPSENILDEGLGANTRRTTK